MRKRRRCEEIVRGEWGRKGDREADIKTEHRVKDTTEGNDGLEITNRGRKERKERKEREERK